MVQMHKACDNAKEEHALPSFKWFGKSIFVRTYFSNACSVKKNVNVKKVSYF